MRSEPVILLVEDNGEDLRLLRHFLAKAGLKQSVESVADGVEAMSYLLGRGAYGDRTRCPQPQLLLIDINMPRVNGLELMSWLRTQPDFDHLIVVALSSSSEQEEINRAYELGANSYLLKPAGADQLDQTINAFVEYWMRRNCLPEASVCAKG